MLKKITRPESPPPWGFLAGLGALIAMFAALVIGTTLAQSLFGDTPAALLAGWSIGMIIAVLFVAVTRMRTPTGIVALRLIGDRSRLPIVLLFGLGMGITLDLLSQIVTGSFNLASSELLTISRQGTTFSGWLLAFLFMVLLQPVGEELVLRGMLYPAVRAAMGAWLTIVLVAGFHAMFHMAAYTPGSDDATVYLWYGLALPFLDALVITGVRAYTGSTRAAIMAHAGIGLFAVLKVFVLAG